MPVVESTIGTVVAYDTVQVTAQVQGRIQSAAFKEGQMVKKGDLLFQIDPRQLLKQPWPRSRARWQRIRPHWTARAVT